MLIKTGIELDVSETTTKDWGEWLNFNILLYKQIQISVYF